MVAQLVNWREMRRAGGIGAGTWFGWNVVRSGGRWRVMIEPLEQRALLSSTLFVYGGAPDATHFNTLQDALAVAVGGDKIVLQSGFSPGGFASTSLDGFASAGDTSIQTSGPLVAGEVVSIGFGGGDPIERVLVTAVTPSGSGFQATLASPLLLDHMFSPVSAVNGSLGPTIGVAQGITLTADAGVVMPFNLEIWKSTSGATLDALDLDTHMLLVDGNGNTVQNSTVGPVLLAAGSQNNAFLNNAITVDTGDGLSLEQANGTIIQGNTIDATADSAFGVVVHNSDHVVITGNTITTGVAGTGVMVTSDGTGVSGADISANTIQTTGGVGIFLQKVDATSTLEVRVQGNKLGGNDLGVFVLGDGTSAGNVDLGGGAGTQFGTNSGGNDFTSFTSANGTHFAIGLFSTSAAFTLQANNNLWGVADPLSVVADGAHTPAAGGTGVIVANVASPTETLTATANNLSAVETGTTAGVVASFTSSLPRVASDFTANIDWGDGTSSQGIVVANASGGFDVMASHTWDDAGNFTFTVTIESVSGAVTDAQGTASISQRVITVQGIDFTIQKKETFSGVVAMFTDNLAGTTVASYVASVAWSDGVTTTATIKKNADGSFSVCTSRSFKVPGVILGSVSVGTVDGAFSGTANFLAIVTNPNDKVPGNPFGNFQRLVKLFKQSHHHKCAPLRPAFSFGHCHR